MKLSDINPSEITEIGDAIDKQAYVQKAINKIDSMIASYSDRDTFPYFILEKGDPENGEDPNLMYLALSKDPNEPRISLSQGDADDAIIHLRDVYFAGLRDQAVALRNAIIAKADELANPE